MKRSPYTSLLLAKITFWQVCYSVCLSVCLFVCLFVCDVASRYLKKESPNHHHT